MEWCKFKASGNSMLPHIKLDQIVYVCLNEQRCFEVGDIVIYKNKLLGVIEFTKN